MQARVTLFEIDTLRISLADALEVFKERVLPRLREQPDAKASWPLRRRKAKACCSPSGTSAEAADEAVNSGFYDEQVGEFTMFLRQPAGREHYEVVFQEMNSAFRPHGSIQPVMSELFGLPMTTLMWIFGCGLLAIVAWSRLAGDTAARPVPALSAQYPAALWTLDAHRPRPDAGDDDHHLRARHGRHRCAFSARDCAAEPWGTSMKSSRRPKKATSKSPAKLSTCSTSIRPTSTRFARPRCSRPRSTAWRPLFWKRSALRT